MPRTIRVAVRRHFVLGLAAFLIVSGLATAYVLYRAPVYEAKSLLSVDPKRSALPDVYERLALQETAIGSEIQLLRSRSLLASVSDELGLQVSLKSPRRTARATYLDDIRTRPDARRAVYRFTRQESGEFVATDRTAEAVVAKVVPGQRVTLPGASFIVRQNTAGLSSFDVATVSRQTSVEALSKSLNVDRPARDANAIVVSMRGTDSELDARIVNNLVQRFIEGRQDVERSDAKGAASFLAAQSDTIARELHAAEDSLRAFRESSGFVRGDEQANSQVRRAIQLQADRGALEAERSSLASVVANVDSAKSTSTSTAPYRRLLAFPSLIKIPAASELLHTLSTLEDERGTLMARRTSVDPEVRAVSERINSANQEVLTLALTYLNGLDKQIAATDLNLRKYDASLRAIPANEVAYSRLDRSVTVLSDAYTMLRKRLKEAQIATDAGDPSVRIVDEALAPDLPVSPSVPVSIAAALCIGLIVGLATCLMRSWSDPKVRTRAQAASVAGAPVLGMIPRVRRSEPALSASSTATTQKHIARPAMPPVSAENRERDVIRDAYSRVNTHLVRALAPTLGRRTILVTSALAGDGKTVSALHLARTAASNGHRVLLIDADLRRRGLSKQQGLGAVEGVSDLLTGRVHDDRAIIRSVDRDADGIGIDIVGAGIAAVEPAEALSTSTFADWLTRVSGDYAAIVLDSPPVIVPDPIVLSRFVDGVVLVVRSNATTNLALRSAMDELTLANAPIVGIVLNDVDFSNRGRYDDDSAAYYGSSYSYAATGE